jgi:phage tail sheath protein FI
MRPGTEVEVIETAPPLSFPTDTGVAFLAGLTEKGVTDKPILITSLEKYKELLGARVSYGLIYDWLEAFFTEGGGRAYISRVVGPAAIKASANLSDGTGTTLKIEAISPGEWGNSLNVTVDNVSGGNFDILITHDTDATVQERFSGLADTQAAITALDFSQYVRGVEQASPGDPTATAAMSLTLGADDRASVTNTQWQAAIDRFDAKLGPGQVAAPGSSGLGGYLLSHAQARNRFALIQGPNTSTKATIKADVATVTGSRDGFYVGSWIKIRGLTAGTTRVIPGAAIVAGLMARVDRSRTPNTPAAGELGQSVTAVEIANDFSDSDIEDLANSEVNTFRLHGGRIMLWGYRTLADKDAVPNWWQAGHSRLAMALKAEGDAVANRYVFAEIDGGRRKLSQYEGDLVDVCAPYYRAGSLYGATADDAFRVDATSEDANPDSQLAAGIVRGIMYVRMAPFAELVRLEIVKLPITESIPA